ncbi:MAG: aminotransferase class V-fold PLP-dependent enzyme [Phycisphaera sp.]|nr:aminotransferase class V-fold PLP-dependent enzyme [Phycisphaera sp.]
MTYFDNAATSFPKPPQVGQAMAKFLAEDSANPGRAGHRMAVAAERMLDDSRLKLTRLFDAPDPHRMVFALNGTDALNIAIKGVITSHVNSNGHKPHVITTVLEHNSVSRPLVALEQAGAIELTRIDCDDQGLIDPDDIRKAVKPNTLLVALTHASNVLGTIQDAAAIGRITRELGVLFLLDAAQTAGCVPVSVKAMNIDLLAFPGHKSLLGPTGTGGLYVGQGVDKITPWREGGTGGDSSTPTQPTLYPYLLEGGTPNTVGIAGLSAGVDFVLTHGIDHALQHEQAMVAQILERFGGDDRFTFYGSRDPRKHVGTLSLNIEGYDAPDLGAILDDSFGIAVRPGLHCAPYIHKRIGTFPDGAVRISPGVFNTDEQLAHLCDALEQVAG